MGRGKTWATKEVTRLADLIGECGDWDEVAERFGGGRTRAAVKKMAISRHLGSPNGARHLYTERERGYIASAWESGVPLVKMAQRLGKSETAVMSQVVKLGAHRSNHGWSDEQRRTAVEMRAEGATYAQIAKRIGKGEDTVGVMLRKMR